ncbi:MAG: hypothetical protein KDA87_14575, partial [Planctomycetales bacterium]|nr:hypothetical protein [Planctomycetales bacterium]
MKTKASYRNRQKQKLRTVPRGPIEQLEDRHLMASDLAVELLLQLGDFDENGTLAPNDIDLLTAEIQQGSQDLRFDVDQSGSLDNADRRAWVEGLRRTFFGDSNVDGQFSSADLVLVFQQGTYEDSIAQNSTWTTGDWNGDGEFTTSDLVSAFQAGGYEQGFRTMHVQNLQLSESSRSDPSRLYESSSRSVVLVGQTEPFVVAILDETGEMTVADRNGYFEFNHVPLPLGSSEFQVTVCDINNSQARQTQSFSRTAPEGGVLLSEVNSFYSESATEILLDSQFAQQRLVFDVELKLDLASANPAVEDRLLVYLVDAADPSKFLMDGGIPGTPVFSLSSQGAAFPAGKVRFDGNTVQIDVSGVPDGTIGKLVFQLLGNDGDSGTLAAIGPVESTYVAAPTDLAVVVGGGEMALRPGDAIAVAGLSASTSLRPLLSNVRYHSTTDRYEAELRVQNVGSAATGRQMVVTFPNLPASVQVTNRSAALPNGTPYLNIQNAVPAGGLLPGDVSHPVRLELLVPQSNRFILAPTVLVGGPNRSPIMPGLSPVDMHPGESTTIAFNSTDPDGDELTYSLFSANQQFPNLTLLPNGQLRIYPDLNQLGTYSLTVTASDGALSVSRPLVVSVTPDSVETTRVSGVVTDVSGDAISGVPVELGGFSATTSADGSFTISLPTLLVPTESFHISVPSGDSLLDPFNTGTQEIRLRRARYDVATGDSIENPRQHPNLVSSFLDASVVYGSDTQRATALRTGTGGRLKTSSGPGNTTLLPRNNTTTFPAGVLENDNEGRIDPALLFAAGDVRANENVALLSLHTLLVREHNRLATQFQTANPTWTDERIFQEARRTVGAIIQQITYSEYLPLLLGANAIPAYTGYKSDVRPDESGLFAVAAFRVGHTQLGSEVQRLGANGQTLPGGPLALKDAFFTPTPVQTDGIEPYLRGMAGTAAQEIDTQLVDDVRNFLFGPAGSGGLDLASLNIQRGRDMGLPSYNQARIDFGLPAVQSFEEITSNPSVQESLRNVFGSVDLIDVWVGGIAEDHAPGAQVGPLFQR